MSAVTASEVSLSNGDLDAIQEGVLPYVPLGVLVFDQQGILINLNPRVVEITGFQREQLIGSQFFDVVIGDTALRERLLLLLRAGFIRDLDFGVSIKQADSDATIDLRVASSCIDALGRPFMLVILHDSTLRLAYEQVIESGFDQFVRTTLALDAAMNKIREQARNDTRQLQQARQIQQHLLPNDVPDVPGLRFAAIYEPTELIGGDLYDFVELADGSIGIFVADVSGHGVPAAMIASMAKLVLSLFGSTTNFPGKMLAALNMSLYGKIASNFLTCCYAIVSPDRRRLTFAGAGHPPLLHVRNKVPAYHRAPGKPVGWFPRLDFEDRELTLMSGDRVLIYSDGLTEASNGIGEMFDEERLREAVGAGAGHPLGVQLNTIISQVRDFQGCGAFKDDVTFVGIEIT